MTTIFHIALASDWEAARAAGAYTVSTLGRTLAEEGFIHASRADQWTGVRDRFYAGVTEPLVLLQIDTDRLDVPVVEEPAVPGATETFPHIYGPLRTEAVVRAMPLPSTPVVEEVAQQPPTPVVEEVAQRPSTPVVEEVAQRPSRDPAIPGAPDNFSSVFLGEMFANLLIAGVVLAGVIIGIGLGAVTGSAVAMLVGAAVGAAVGLVLARRLYLRRGRPAS